MPGAVIHGQEQDDESTRGEAADVAEALDKEDLSAVAGGGDRGGQPSRAAADDEHVNPRHYGDARLREVDEFRFRSRSHWRLWAGEKAAWRGWAPWPCPARCCRRPGAGAR